MIGRGSHAYENADEYAAEWRTKLVDNAFEGFTASDGSKAILPRA